jgi:acetoin utilization deacetylase AcuC-like enzyme
MLGRGSFEIALLSAGAAYRAVGAVLRGEVDNAYALCRPAGYHALADLGIGMCVFGNVALVLGMSLIPDTISRPAPITVHLR